MRQPSPVRILVCALAYLAIIPAVVLAVMGIGWRLGVAGVTAYIVSIGLASWYAGCTLLAEARIARTDGVRNYLPPRAAVWVSVAFWAVATVMAAVQTSHTVVLACWCGVPALLALVSLLLRSGQPAAPPHP